MHTTLTKLSAIVAKETETLGTEPRVNARLIELKLSSPDGRYHTYVQMLIVKDRGTAPYALWRKFKANASLTQGSTLWESTTEYDPELLAGSIKMIEERIEDLADKAQIPQPSIKITFEMSKPVALDSVTRTQDSRYSYVVKICGITRQHRHV